mmetsp:Transcript_22386/g.71616  ORF Transcript_22386/g.71616 Transcript_22386/m.71616 type:complete len:203 (-) Transcript_22386:127-735(-)
MGIPNLSSTAYWAKEAFRDSRGAREWFTGVSAALKMVERALPPSTSRVAHLGSGLSKFGNALATRRPDIHVTNVDCSSDALMRLRDASGPQPNVAYVRDDLGKSQLPSAAFDLVLDKGTLDVFEIGKQDVSYLTTVERILRPGGIFYQVSDRAPEARDSLLLSDLWASASWSPLSTDLSSYWDDDSGLFLYRCVVGASKRNG